MSCLGRGVARRAILFTQSTAVLHKYLNDELKLLCLSLLRLFNGLFSRTTWVSRYEKGKTSLDFSEARDNEWQWQLGHMYVCTSLQTDNHASTPPLSFFTGRMPFLTPNQQHQSTEGKIAAEFLLKLNRKSYAYRMVSMAMTLSNPLPPKTTPFFTFCTTIHSIITGAPRDFKLDV